MRCFLGRPFSQVRQIDQLQVPKKLIPRQIANLPFVGGLSLGMRNALGKMAKLQIQINLSLPHSRCSRLPLFPWSFSLENPSEHGPHGYRYHEIFVAFPPRA